MSAKRIYLASSWRNTMQPSLVNDFRSWGHEVYDFHHPHLGPGAGGGGFSWSSIDKDWEFWTPMLYRQALNFPEAQDGFLSDMAGMEWADTCVLLLPSGRSAHTEAGWMKGQGKTTFVLSYGLIDPELMYLLYDRICITEPEIMEALEHA